MGDRVDNLPGKLSGGQQQRVAIARAHSPTSFGCVRRADLRADAHTGHTIMELLRGNAIEGDRAVMIVTHDSRIFEFADSMARMDDGRIVPVERRDGRLDQLHVAAVAS